MAFRKTRKVRNNSVNIDYISTTEYVSGKADITTPDGGASYEKRKIMFADLNGMLFDWYTGNQLVEAQHPHISDIFRDTDLDYNLDTTEIFEENGLIYKYDCMEFYYGPSSYQNINYYIDDNDNFSLMSAEKTFVSSGDPISIVHENGDIYNGNYQILLRRVYSESVEVTTGTDEYSIASHSGMTAYYVTVLLASDISNLYVRFPSGDLQEVDGNPGEYYPININPNYKEKIYPSDIFKYVSPEELETTAGNNIVSSIKTDKGYKILTKDRAILDSRELDFFFWRIRAKLNTESNIISVGQEVVKIGVIGSTVDDTFAKFLDGDLAFSLKYKFQNPHKLNSHTGRWNISPSIPLSDLNNYDIVIFRDSAIDYTQYASKINDFINNGGVVLLDFNRIKPNIIDSNIDALKLNLTFSNPEANVSPYIYVGNIGEYLFNSPSNYTISEDERKKIKGNTYTINIHSDNTLIKSANNASIFSKVKDGLNNGAIYATTLGLTMLSSLSVNDFIGPEEQILINFIAENLKIDTEILDTKKIPSGWEVKTPWIYSFVAGYDTDGTPLLTSSELDKYRFYSTSDSDGNIIWRRKLSSSNSEKLIRDSIRAQGWESILKNAEIYDYEIDVETINGDFVEVGLTNAGSPWAQSSRVSEGLDLPDGYRWIEYDETDDASINIPNTTAKSIGLKVLGTFSTADSYEFSWNLKGIAEQKITTTGTNTSQKIVKSSINLDCDWFESVTVESDTKWHRYDTSKSLLHDANLKSWNKLTAAKWYPWDGHVYYAHNGSTGEKVAFYQRLINGLKAVGRHRPPGSSYTIRNLPLKVDGKFSTKTKEAWSDYQLAWKIPHDPAALGVIDAGTAGHMMWNVGHAMAYDSDYKKIPSEFREIYTKYGHPNRILDGDNSTGYGKRTWFNSSVFSKEGEMRDVIVIKLNRKVKITSLNLRSLSVNNRPIRVKQISSYQNSTEGWKHWYDRSDNESINIYNDETKSLNLADRTATQLRLKFFQKNRIDTSKYNNAMMWGFKTIEFKGEIANTSTSSWTSVTYKDIPFTHSITETSIMYDTPYTVTITPSEVTNIISTFNGYKTTTTDIANYIKGTIQPTRTNKFCGDVLDSGTQKYLQLLDNAKSIVSCKRLDNGVDVPLSYLTIDNDSSKINIAAGAGLDEGTVLEVIFYAIVDIDVSVTLDNITGKISITFTQTEILEDAAGPAVWGPEWLATINSDENVVLDDGSHFPDTLLSDAPSSEMYDIRLSIVSKGGDSTLAGAFYDVSDKNYFSTLSAEEYFARKQNLRLAVLQKKIVLDARSFVGTTEYPKRYGCKPFCLAWTFGENTFGTRGLTGDTAENPWNLRVNAGILNKKLNYQNVEDINGANNNLVITYNIASNFYSTVDGYPYVNVANEVVDIIDINKISLDRFPVIINDSKSVTNESLLSSSYLRMMPENKRNRVPIISISQLQYSVNGTTGWTTYAMTNGATQNWSLSSILGEVNLHEVPGGGENDFYWRFTGVLMKQEPSITLAAYRNNSGTKTAVSNETLEVLWVDNQTGVVTFDSALDYDYINGTDGYWIEATYKFREEFIVYDGYVDNQTTPTKKYVFDACPYDGHYIYNDVSGALEKTIDNIGNNIYIYAKPSLITGNTVYIKQNGGLYHTFSNDIFDISSDSYDPYALKIATINMKQTINSKELVKIDTRKGGGGYLDADKNIIIQNNPNESIWDFNHLDGNLYFKGGSIIITLPESWKEYWIQREIIYNNLNNYDANKAVEKRALEIAQKYGPAGKHYYIEWDSTNEE